MQTNRPTLLALFFIVLTGFLQCYGQTDFAVTSFSSGTGMMPGNTYTVKVIVSNNGSSFAFSPHYRVYLSTDSVYDVADISVASANTGYIHYPAGPIPVNATITIPASALGNYFLLFYVDDANAVSETNESNNMIGKAITVSPFLTDLRVKDCFIAQRDVYDQTSQGMTVRVMNTGNVTVPTSNIAVYLSSDSIYDVSDVSVGTLSGTSVLSGSTVYSRTLTITIPSTSPGDYYLLAYIDPANLETESDETNNVAPFPVTISHAQADLIITNPSAGAPAVLAAATYTASYTVFNKGERLSPNSAAGVYLSSDAALDAGDPLIGSGSGTFLSTQTGGSRTATYQVPAGTAAGNYFLIIKADQNMTIPEADETNNTFAVPLNVIAPATEIFNTSPTLTPAAVSKGSVITVGTTVYNTGTANLSNVITGFYLSADDVHDGSDLLLGTRTTTVNAGSSSIITTTLTIPAGVAAGRYKILYALDHTNQIAESVEYNNLNKTELLVTAVSHDVELVNMYTATPAVPPSSGFFVQYTLANPGNFAEANIRTGYYLSSDAVWDAGDVNIGNSLYTPSLGPGSLINVPTAGNPVIPAGTASGSYYLIGVADYLGTIAETNESNNYFTMPVTVVAMNFPDLRMQRLSLASSDFFVSGGIVSPSFEVANTGSWLSPSNNVGIYLSADSVYDVSDVFLASSAGGSLAAGAVASRTVNFTVTAAPGNYYLIYAADYAGSVAESNEGNNYLSVPVKIRPALPDLEIVRTNTTRLVVTAGEPVTNNILLWNLGATGTSAGSFACYLSADSLYDGTDVLLASGGPLSVNRYAGTFQTPSLTIPLNTPTGAYYILNVADPAGAVSEVSETNNVSWSRIKVENVNAISHVMPVAGTYTMQTCNAAIYDDGGASGNYSNNVNTVLTILPDNPGDRVVLTFEPGVIATGDLLRVYNGPSVTDPTLGSFASALSSVKVSSHPSGALTISFVTDTSNTDLGFVIRTGCIAAASLPDFSVNPVYVNYQYNIAGGSAVSHRNYICNTGASGPYTAVAHRIYLSADSTISADDTLLNTFTYAYTATSSSVTSSLTIPMNRRPGTYYLITMADPDNLVAETNENNNISIQPLRISLFQGSDLLPVVDKSRYAIMQRGVPAELVLSVGNPYANAGAAASQTGVYWSSDSLYDPSDVLLATVAQGIMNPGVVFSYRVVNGITVPATTVPGNYFLLFKADNQSVIYESDEENNILAVPVNVPQAVSDIRPYCFNAPASAVAGDSLAVSAVVFNEALSANTFNTAVYFSADAVFDAGDVRIGTSTSASLASNTFGTFSLQAGIPAATPTGNYYLICKADDSDSISEVNETNNIQVLPLQIELSQNPDLAIFSQGLGTTQPVPASGVVSAYYSNANSSNTPFSNVLNGFYLSPDNAWDAADVQLSPGAPVYVDAYTTLSGRQDFTIPPGTAPGNYYVVYRSDDASTIAEITETNNDAYHPITVSASSADLYTTNNSIPYPIAAAGSSINASCYIANTGNLPAGPFSVACYLSADNIFDAGDAPLNTYSSPVLNAGSLTPVTISLPMPAATGNYYILFVADNLSQVAENNETNNVSYLPVEVQNGYVDLVNRFLGAVPRAAQGSTISPFCQTLNQGNILAVAASVRFVISADTIYDATDSLAQIDLGPALDPGVLSPIRNVVLTVPMAPPGHYYLLFMADANSNSLESDETNNVSWLPFEIYAPVPDLSVQAFSAPASMVTGLTYTVTGSYQNQGFVASGAHTNGYYLSLDNVYDATDVLLTTSVHMNVGIPPSSSTGNISTGITIPVGTAPGQYYIVLNLDHQLVLNETIRTNNTAAAPVVVTSSLPDLWVDYTSAYNYTRIPGASFSVRTSGFNTTNVSSSSVSEGFYLSADTTWNSSDVYLGNQSYISIGAFTNRANPAFNLTVPLSTSPGQYYVIAFIDNTLGNTETNETNNYDFFPLTVTDPGYDLSIANPSLSVTGIVDGGSLTVNSSVQNTSAYPVQSGSELHYYLSTDSLFDGSDVLLFDSSLSSVPALSGISFSQALTIPLGTTAGAYYILEIADFTNIINESSETNNMEVYPLQVIAGYNELSLSLPVLGGTTVVAGSSLPAGCELHNNGNYSLPLVSNGFYLSVDTVYDVSDILLTTELVSAVAPGSSSAINSTVTIPSATPWGNYYILYFTDNTTAIAEQTETNNVLYSPLLVIGFNVIDLQVENAQLAVSTISPGVLFAVACDEYNYGSVTSNAAFGYYLSADTVYDAGDVLMLALPAQPLAYTAPLALNDQISVPAGTPDGNYYVLFVADHDSLETETDESNNVQYVPLIVLDPVGLKGTDDSYGLVLFPNPADRELRIGTGNDNDLLSGVILYDLQGKELGRFSAPAGSSEMIIPVNSLANGVYSVVILTAQGASTRKLIITR